jgi:hypothetical protein
MDQVPLSVQDSVYGVGKVPADLAHPQAVRRTSDPADLHRPSR